MGFSYLNDPNHQAAGSGITPLILGWSIILGSFLCGCFLEKCIHKVKTHWIRTALPIVVSCYSRFPGHLKCGPSTFSTMLLSYPENMLNLSECQKLTRSIRNRFAKNMGCHISSLTWLSLKSCISMQPKSFRSVCLPLLAAASDSVSTYFLIDRLLHILTFSCSSRLRWRLSYLVFSLFAASLLLRPIHIFALGIWRFGSVFLTLSKRLDLCCS